MNAEVLSIGTELLLGEVIDTNTSYLAAQLPLLGINLHRVILVGDNRERLSEALHQAWKRSDIIFTSGGLGPTEDDITREVIAEFLDEELNVSPELEQELRLFFARMGREMSSHNIKQATIIPSARAIPNPRGTAPGWWIEKEKKIIVAMPGPPWEMQNMWVKEVMPRLQQKIQGDFILSRTLKTFGLSEARVNEVVSPLFVSADPELGIYAKPDGIHLRIIARAAKREVAEKIIAQHEAHLREILAKYIWGFDNDTLEGIVGELLIEKGLTLATMESFTGGLLASTLTSVLGNSSSYKGGFVASSNEAKITLGVDTQLIRQYGSISTEGAEAMAMAVCQRLGADIGVGVTGVAGPDIIEGKSPGLVYIAICGDREKWTGDWNFPPPLQLNNIATVAALFALRQRLLSIN